jgi:hypothetical protein
MPIPSNERSRVAPAHATALVRAHALVAALCVALMAAVSPAAWAHGDEADDASALPAPGWSATWAERHLHAASPLPSQVMSGFLLKGDAGNELRGTALEHAAVSASARAFDGWVLHGELSQHGRDPVHVEAAWAARPVGPSASPMHLSWGRQLPALGALWTTAGHLDRFSLMPLAKQAATDGDWTDDGASLQWRPQLDTPLGMLKQSMQLGLWQGHAFPGSRDTGGAPSLHWGATLDHPSGTWRLDAFAARWQVDGRGARLNLAGRGHSHVAPRCDDSLNSVVCFSGRSVVSGWSLGWSQGPLDVAVGGLQRRERGQLLSRNGLVDDDSLQAGQLAQAWWRGPGLDLGWRSERAMARHRLDGSGATAVAQDAGLNSYAPISRHTLAVAWPVPATWLAWARRGPVQEADARISLETGREQQGAQALRFTTLRLVLGTAGLW